MPRAILDVVRRDKIDAMKLQPFDGASSAVAMLAERAGIELHGVALAKLQVLVRELRETPEKMRTQLSGDVAMRTEPVAVATRQRSLREEQHQLRLPSAETTGSSATMMATETEKSNSSEKSNRDTPETDQAVEHADFEPGTADDDQRLIINVWDFVREAFFVVFC